MGLFDIFKKSKEPEKTAEQVPMAQTSQNSASISRDDYGNIVVEYYDAKATAREFYDTTKLVIGPTPIEVEGAKVYSAKVAWYGENDCMMIDKNGRDMGRRGDFRSIKLEIDEDRLYSDPTYQKVLMTQLLSQNRVNRYLQRGLEENPEQPCGDYVGRVSREYKKQFDLTVGQAIHNSPEMIEKRQRHFERKEKARQEKLKEKQEELKRLQEEINGLSK